MNSFKSKLTVLGTVGLLFLGACSNGNQAANTENSQATTSTSTAQSSASPAVKTEEHGKTHGGQVVETGAYHLEFVPEKEANETHMDFYLLNGDNHEIIPNAKVTAMEDKVAGLDAGADDYLVKPFGMAELLARMRALQRRTPHFQPQELTVGNLTLDYGSSTVISQNATGDKQVISLTNKEFHLLEYFMKHPNQIITTEQLRYQLWEVGAETISNVVAAQMRLLRRKLTNSGCSNPIETLHGLGYRLSLNHESK